jgi:seryl-tRNA synthetase
MHDIKKIRDDPKEFDQQLKKRNINPLSSSILKIDAKRRKNIASLEILKSSINSLSKDFGRNKSLGKSIDEKKFKDVIKEKKLKISKLEDESQKLETNLKALLENIPNICSLDVPDGVGQEDNDF